MNIPLSVELVDNIQISFKKIELTPEELKILAQVFTNPTVIKYLEHLSASLITDHATIPLSKLTENAMMHSILQAFVKGNLNMAQTLLNIGVKPAQQTNSAQGVR